MKYHQHTKHHQSNQENDVEQQRQTEKKEDDTGDDEDEDVEEEDICGCCNRYRHCHEHCPHKCIEQNSWGVAEM